jgi:hypothetical protein
MLIALFNLAVNWLSSWDFRTLGNLSLLVISSEFLFVVLNYFFCALVSPDFEGGETYDLRRFHESEGPTYILVFVAIVAIAVIEHFGAGAGLGMSKEGAENALVIFQLPLALLPLFVKRSWVQVTAPAALLITVWPVAAMLMRPTLGIVGAQQPSLSPSPPFQRSKAFQQQLCGPISIFYLLSGSYNRPDFP